MKLPAKIKVGWADYRIDLWKPEEEIDDQRFGQTNNGALTIRVNTGHGEAQTVETLLHEALHAICHVWDADLEREVEEKVVTRLASGLHALWRDNPELIKFIDQSIRK